MNKQILSHRQSQSTGLKWKDFKTDKGLKPITDKQQKDREKWTMLLLTLLNNSQPHRQNAKSITTLHGFIVNTVNNLFF